VSAGSARRGPSDWDTWQSTERKIGMDLPRITTQEEWLTAREELRAAEEALAQERDTVKAERGRLPMVEIGNGYAFDGPDGRAGLLDLFDGHRQLLTYHFWFEPGGEPCDGCSLWVRNLGYVTGLHERDTSLVLVSPASSAEIEAVRERRNWTVPWFSAIGTDFNDDMGYTGVAQITVFVRDGNSVYRTYATSGSVLETLSNHWSLMDLTPLGLQ
jgi:predicted dithiol-disulfide oxidoreductase (DUF899 family)